MSINNYLVSLAGSAIIRDNEQASIRRSVATLTSRLDQHFGREITDRVLFGSYSRGTILPRIMDERSDVDYMVVFRDGQSRPQTYLDRLRRFVERWYTRSEISQSNPTIVLSLNHIRFELVPAVNNWYSGLQIPAKANDAQDWIETNPTGFNRQLTNANQTNNNQIKPLIRLLKYWNVKNGYPFESFALEKGVVQHNFFGLSVYGLFRTVQLKDYLYSYIEEMDAGFFAPQKRRQAVARAQQLVTDVRDAENFGDFASAERIIKRLLPPLGLLV